MQCSICSFAVGVDQPAQAAALVMQAHVLMHIANSLNKIAEAAAQMVGKS